jgi:hypothetical protein
MSITVESTEDVRVEWVSFVLQTKGEFIDRGNTIGFLDEGAKVLGQLIFAEKQPKVSRDGTFLLYDLAGNRRETIQIWASAFSVSDDPDFYRSEETKASFIDGVLAEKLDSYFKVENAADLSLDVFDYRTAIEANGISYIVCRDSGMIPKFANDPAFHLVFINDEVAIFMVK